jgi:hypothetical protein
MMRTGHVVAVHPPPFASPLRRSRGPLLSASGNSVLIGYGLCRIQERIGTGHLADRIFITRRIFGHGHVLSGCQGKRAPNLTAVELRGWITSCGILYAIDNLLMAPHCPLNKAWHGSRA